jgi:competence protein ComEC
MTRAGWGIPTGLVAGVVLAQVFFIKQLLIWPLIAGLLLYFAVRRRAWVAAAFLGLGWATLSLHLHLADRLDSALSGSRQIIEGRIEGLPEVHDDFTRFRFQPAAGEGAVSLPRSFLTYWYRDPPALLPGETWRLELLLKPPWGWVNFHGPDREMWLFAEGIGGLATVRSGERLRPNSHYFSNWNALRQTIRSRLNQSVSNENNRAVVAALAIADRSSLSARQRDILQRTGTAHLLAISGLHIGLAALCGLWLARLLILAVPLRWSMGLAYPVTLVASFVLAVLYAALAGFGTSTVRAMLMLAVAILAMLLRRAIHPGQAILTALALILLFDPLAFLSAGFWLSFAAVGVLLLLFSKGNSRDRSWWRQMLRAQAGIMVVLLPLTAWWFQSASVSGLIANFLAIPWVSVVVVPSILLGLILLPCSDVLSALAFSAAGGAAGLLLKVLDVLARLPVSSLALPQPSVWSLALATLGALMLLLPRGIRHRWLGVLLLLPLFIADQAPAGQQIQIDVLDVGQGTAVLVNSSRHLLLYDSGPGDGKNFDVVDSVIRPAVLRSGHTSPDRILISHNDLDHSGGLNSLRNRYPAAAVYASLPEAVEGIEPCDDTLHWQWDGMAFQVLHPSAYLPYIGNDSSCVLSIKMDQATVWLPGDISQVIEQRLLSRHAEKLDVLMAPHHGSNTGSSAEFLQVMQPAVALAAAGLGNRFDFPHPAVQQRYRAAGIPLWSTEACGALRLHITADGTIQGYSARRLRPAPWRWPAGESCP